MKVVEPSEAAQWGLGLRERPSKDGIVINLDGAGRPVTNPDTRPEEREKIYGEESK